MYIHIYFKHIYIYTYINVSNVINAQRNRAQQEGSSVVGWANYNKLDVKNRGQTGSMNHIHRRIIQRPTNKPHQTLHL